MAGLIIAQVGAGAVFALNAVSFVVFAVVLLFLRRPAAAVEGTPERFASAMRAGRRYVRNSPTVRRMLLRVGLFVLPGAALWALLPLVASRLLGAGPTGYGVLLAALGAGAVLGADLLPRFGGRLSPNRLLLVAGAAFTASLLACVLVRNLVALAILLVPAGIAWLWVLMTVSGALQVFLPGWVRARGLSMYNIVFAGGQAIGALLWGLLAQWWGLVPMFLAAAAVMALGTATVGGVAAARRRRAGPRPRRVHARSRAGPRARSRRGSGAGHADLPRRGRPGARVRRGHGTRSAGPGCAPARAAASCTRTGRTCPSSSRSRCTPPGGNTCATTPAG